MSKHVIDGRSQVGARAERVDGRAKATGTSVYASDFALPGMLYGAVCRSTVPHGRIRNVDIEAAACAPGVRAVVRGTDYELCRFGQAIKDTEVLASNYVRYVGQPVVLVAAESPVQAAHAAALVRLSYEELAAVFDPEAALEATSPLVHPEWHTYLAPPILPRDGNKCAHAVIEVGDVAAAFQTCFRIFEHRFTTSAVHPGYTEPRAAIALWSGTDESWVWSNTQLPFDTQAALAEIFGVPIGKIRVAVPGTGGGFGGKLRLGLEHFALLLSRASGGRPVKMVSTSHEELTAALPRQPCIIYLKTGVNQSGILVAKEARIIVDAGACAGSGPQVASASTQGLAGPYRIPHMRIEGLAVYTNKTPMGSVRAPSGPMANFAVESQMDIIAKDLNIDPLEFRLRNIVREGDRGPSGQVLRGVGLEECLLKAANAIEWPAKPGGSRAKGIACGWWGTSSGPSGVFVKVASDGSVHLNTGAVEIGTGALTGAAQLLAEELGIDASAIRMSAPDTHLSPHDMGSQGSRTLFGVGNACLDAARQLRLQILEIAGAFFDTEPERLELREGHVFFGNRSISLGAIATRAQQTKGGLIAHGTFVPPAVPYEAVRLRNHQAPAWPSPSFHAQAVDLSVDEETGEVTIHRYVVAQDVGRVINPTGLEGQIEGGVVQGLGQALSEEIVFSQGYVQNPNLTDYKMPIALDAPRVESIFVEHASEVGPFGAKGAGEPPVIEPAAAVANAVAAATGRRITSLPITAEKIACYPVASV